MDTLYTEIILDLYKHPLNKSALSDFNAHHAEANPVCGDSVEVFIKFDENDTVAAISWTGDGCAISQASASVVTDFVKNKKKQDIKNITGDDVLSLLNLEQLNPTRIRCALLILECIKNSK